MLAAIKMNYKAQSLLALVLIFTISLSCEKKPIYKNQKIKTISEWRCDPCFMGSALVEKWFKTDFKKIQYFDTTGRLLREAETYMEKYTTISNYHYDSLNRINLVNYDDQINRQDTSLISKATYRYNSDASSVKILRGDETNPHTIEEHKYDSLKRKISEAYTFYQQSPENRYLLILYKYDSLNRLIRRYSHEDKESEGRFYYYPSKTTIEERMIDKTSNFIYHTRSYLNEKQQTLYDSTFEENVSTKEYKFTSTNKYIYNDSGQLEKIIQYYYNFPSCLTDQKKGWYTAITEYKYEYY
jgi:hypothetical protein